jgi:hypothetical protein
MRNVLDPDGVGVDLDQREFEPAGGLNPCHARLCPKLILTLVLGALIAGQTKLD